MSDVKKDTLVGNDAEEVVIDIPSTAGDTEENTSATAPTNNIQADILTTAAAIGELFSSGISNAVGTAEIVDILIELITGQVKNNTGFGFSVPGLAVGLSYSALITLGSVYAHYLMNKNNQTNEAPDGYSPLSQHESLSQGSQGTFKQTLQKLKWYQLLAVIADLLSDTGAKVGVNLGVLKIILDSYNAKHINDPLSKVATFAWKGSVMALSLVGGVFSSLADVRSVAVNMAELNEKEEAHKAYSPC